MGQEKIIVLGAGLAGSEAAFQIASRGIPVELWEMRPTRMTEAHVTSKCAEMVCSNSFGSVTDGSASGVLKQELDALNPFVLQVARQMKVAAGASLAVDREKFSQKINEVLEAHPLIEIRREEAQKIPKESISIVATGPLTSEGLADDLAQLLGEDSLYFYDAISPIVATDSLDLDKMFYASRYNKGDADFLNIPLNKDQYFEFVNDLLGAEKAVAHEFEKEKYFESCMPIETIASRGERTLAFGPMKPVGLDDPKTGKWAYAVIQLRAENDYKTAYNLVGFQTKMKYGEQMRVFRKLPGLENAEFLRLGSIHRNTFINSPKHLLATLQLRNSENTFLAGQLTGTEGYLESSACGLVAGVNAARLYRGDSPLTLPRETMLGELLHAITEPGRKNFQPMNVNMGLLPPLEYREKDKKLRKSLMGSRAVEKMNAYLEQNPAFIQKSFSESYKYLSSGHEADSHSPL